MHPKNRYNRGNSTKTRQKYDIFPSSFQISTHFVGNHTQFIRKFVPVFTTLACFPITHHDTFPVQVWTYLLPLGIAAAMPYTRTCKRRDDVVGNKKPQRKRHGEIRRTHIRLRERIADNAPSNDITGGESPRKAVHGGLRRRHTAPNATAQPQLFAFGKHLYLTPARRPLSGTDWIDFHIFTPRKGSATTHL